MFTHNATNGGDTVFGAMVGDTNGGVLTPNFTGEPLYREYVVSTGATTFTKAGAGVSALTGSGSKVVEWVKTGAGTSPAVGSSRVR